MDQRARLKLNLGGSHERSADVSGTKRHDESLAVASAPLARASLWLAAVAALAAIAVFAVADMDFVKRHTSMPGVLIELSAIALTAIIAILAAFRLSEPNAPRLWVYAPAPSLALWLIACATECLGRIAANGPSAWDLGDSPHCILFILAVSIPLGISVMAIYRIRPGRAAAYAGLGVATIAIGLLQFFHTFDSNLTDLIAHIVAAAIVVGGVTYSAQLLPTVRI